MFRLLGNTVIRVWPFILVVWIIVLSALVFRAPEWSSVIDEGEFAFLPDDMPSLKGESIYEEAWGEPFASNIVIVLWRERHKLEFDDTDFIDSVLAPRLTEIIEEVGIPEPLKSPDDVGDGKPTDGQDDSTTDDDSTDDDSDDDTKDSDDPDKATDKKATDRIVKTHASPGMKEIYYCSLEI